MAGEQRRELGMKDPASDADPCRVRPVCQQQLGHGQAALCGGTAQRPHTAWKRMCDVVEDEPQRCDLPARDRVLDGCDVEDVDGRIRLLAVTRGAAQPLTEEQLLHRPAVS